MSNTVRLRPRDFPTERDAWNRPWENDPQFHMERDEESQAQMRRIAAKTPHPVTGCDLFDGDEARDMGLHRNRL